MAMSDRFPGIRPRLTMGRRLDIVWRQAFPGITSILLMLLSVANFGPRGQSALLPMVSIICVWFWSLYRPAAMSPPIAFVIGLLLDLLGYLPLGVGPVTMLTTHGLARQLRRFLVRQGFMVVWLTFIVVAFGIAVMNWTLVSLLTLSVEPPGPMLLVAGLVAATYPVIALPLALAHRSIADPDLA
jgi:rod shape-determining protein MreD